MRRLDTVSRSPLYSIYGETIAGETVIRAFDASSKFLRDMLRCVDMIAPLRLWGLGRKEQNEDYLAAPFLFFVFSTHLIGTLYTISTLVIL